jgi:hypothetical protein
VEERPCQASVDGLIAVSLRKGDDSVSLHFAPAYLPGLLCAAGVALLSTVIVAGVGGWRRKAIP